VTPLPTSLSRRLTLAAVPLTLILAAGCGTKGAKPPRPQIPVTAATVRRADVPYTLLANGLVTPIQSAAVGSQVDGIIASVAFREGQDVARGQVLFQIDPRPYQAAYNQAVAAEHRDRATADNADQEAVRYTQLEAKDYATKEQADQQRAAAAVAHAALEADEAALATAKFNLDNTTIRAPISGRTGSLLVRVGNLVHAASTTPLVLINQIHPIQVRFTVPASELTLVQRYAVHAELPVIATPGPPLNRGSDTTSGDTPVTTQVGSAGGDPPAPGTALRTVGPVVQGTLAFIDNAIDTTTGTLLLKATFANPDGALWPGEFVATSLRLFVEKDALVVPAQAVITGQQGLSVYVVDSTGSALSRRVTVERSSGGLAVIASGLSLGERVVTEGQSRLAPGAKVALKTGAAAAAPAGKGDSATTGGRHRGQHSQ